MHCDHCKCYNDLMKANAQVVKDNINITREHQIFEGLKKRIEEFDSYKDGTGIVIKLDADKNYEVIDISDHILLELQKIMEVYK